MINVSNDYKQAMNKRIRNRTYISVGIGIINQEAQETASTESEKAYWSYGNIFNPNRNGFVEYATLEENYNKADGSLLFMPEDNYLAQFKNNGFVSAETLQPLRIEFPSVYAINGITIDFGMAFPTELKIETADKVLSYTNNGTKFTTTDVLGDTDYILITPLSMVGGEQRLRVKSVLMGVGLAYSNQQTRDFSLDEFVSSISDEIPSEDLRFSFYDEENYFNVDDDNSFIDFLETMQKVSVSFGVTLDNGNIDWNQIATVYLKDWSSANGIVSITATDRLSQMEDEYTLANRIYDRTAYEEAESIFTDAGLQPDEYYIDDYLNDVPLHNPMPPGTHNECLQILANACRCIIKQDEHGIIRILANFANVIDPEDLEVSTNGHTKWSNPDNILIGSDVVYGDLTKDFLKADGKMYFLPEEENYLQTSYVSEQVADNNGYFDDNPAITISMPAAYTYFGVSIDFDGNPPSEMVIHTYKNGVLVGSKAFTGLTKHSTLLNEFNTFDTMVFEFTNGYPNNRVLVNKISFGDLSDYVLTKTDMMAKPVGYKERRVKAVRCKVFTFASDSNGNPEEVEDSVYAYKILNEVGEIKTVQNPLVSTQSHAELLAEWIGNYYANNISYDVDYRGEPRNTAADIIHMDSDVLSNLQVEITRHTLKYNGAFSGSMELRRSLKMIGG